MFVLGNFWDESLLWFLKVLLEQFYFCLRLTWTNSKFSKMYLGNLSQITLSNMSLLALILSQTGITSTLIWPWHLSMASFHVKDKNEDFGLLSVSPSHWSRASGPSFHQSVIMPEIPKNKSNSIQSWYCQSSKPTRFWITFHMLQLMIWSAWTRFPQIALMSQVLKSRYNSTLTCLVPGLRLQLLWNVSHVLARDLEHFKLFSQILPMSQIP